MHPRGRKYHPLLLDGLAAGLAGVETADPAREPAFAAAPLNWAHQLGPEHLGPELTRDEAVELAVTWWRSNDAGSDQVLALDILLDRQVGEWRPA